MSLTNELTNWFGVGSMDFHSNRASVRVLGLSREQSRCDNNFSLSRNKLAAQYSNHRAHSLGQPLFPGIGLLGLVPELLPLDSACDCNLLGRCDGCCLEWFDAITALTAYA